MTYIVSTTAFYTRTETLCAIVENVRGGYREGQQVFLTGSEMTYCSFAFITKIRGQFNKRPGEDPCF